MVDWDTLRLPRTVVADETARLAVVGTSEDVGKVYRQTDDDTYWLLGSVSPNVWYQLVGPYEQVQFSEVAAAPSHSAGLLYWMDDNLNLMTSASGVVRQIGEETQFAARNNTGSPITNGTPVYISGGLGNKTLIAPASNTTVALSQVAGLATHDIAHNANGYVTQFGVVRDLDTSSWPEGTELFLGTSGTLTSTRPSDSAQVVSIGYVLYQHGSAGEVLCYPRRRDVEWFPSGTYEARPLTPSASFTDLEVWSWTDEKFPVFEGQRNQTDWTIEEYRDTGQLKAFFRHDQDNEMHGDVQMSHEWAGTAVSLHLHVIPMSNGSGNVRWSGAYFFGNPSAELPAAASWTAIQVDQTVVPGDQYQREVLNIATPAAPGSPGHSAMLSFHLAREGTNAADTYTTSKDHETAAANMCIESYDVHYQRLLVGSFNLVTGRPVHNPCHFYFAYSYGGVIINEGGVYVTIGGRSVGGNEVEFQVWDVAEGAQKGSAVTTTNTSNTPLTIGPFTLLDGLRELRVRARYTGTADEPVVTGIRVSMK